MIDWMTRKSVKDYQNMEDVKVQTSHGLLSSTVDTCCNVLPFTVELLTRLLINSTLVMADAFNNLSDVVSPTTGFVGMEVTEKLVDEDHSFGHGRTEYITAFIVAPIVIQAGFSPSKTLFGKIWNPEVMAFNMVLVVILLLSVGMKLWMSVFSRTSRKRVQSEVTLATTVDSTGDVVTTSTTIPSIVISGIWGVNIDGFIGLVASMVVIIAGVNIAKDTLAPLIGKATDPKIYEEITDFMEQYNGIVGSHDLIVHNYGPSRNMASIRVEVPSKVDVGVSHEIIDTIERECARKLGILLVTYMDPVEMTNTRVSGFQSMVADVLAILDSRPQFHNLRVVNGTERMNLISDLAVPRNYNSQSRDTIKLRVSECAHKRGSRCYRVITVEDSFYVEIPEDVQE